MLDKRVVFKAIKNIHKKNKFHERKTLFKTNFPCRTRNATIPSTESNITARVLLSKLTSCLLGLPTSPMPPTIIVQPQSLRLGRYPDDEYAITRIYKE